jgi:protein-disulfide isomerase
VKLPPAARGRWRAGAGADILRAHMLRPFRCSSLALSAALLLTTACDRGQTTPQPGQPGVAATPGTPSAPLVLTPAGSCEEAALTLPAGTVVGRMRGADVKVEDLGAELVTAERQALRSYCKEVSEARKVGFDNHVHKTLLEEAAKAEGKDIQAYLKSRVDAEVKPPDDAAIQAFYDANKSEQTPPLELVRDQVIQSMTGSQTDAALERIISGIEAQNGVERLLGDVQMAPVDLANQPYTATIGPDDAVVKLVEFSDFECPYCARAAETFRQLKDKYAGQKVQFSYRHFPLPMHPNAQPAAEYAQCAQAQGKFWPMHDAIFAGSSGLSSDKLKEMAGQAGLDTTALEGCLASGEGAKQVAEDLAKGREAGVEGTPSFYLNGQPFAGNPTVEGLSKAIDAELAKVKG